jgi:hypothetical protein
MFLFGSTLTYRVANAGLCRAELSHIFKWFIGVFTSSVYKKLWFSAQRNTSLQITFSPNVRTWLIVRISVVICATIVGKYIKWIFYTAIEMRKIRNTSKTFHHFVVGDPVFSRNIGILDWPLSEYRSLFNVHRHPTAAWQNASGSC